MTRYLTWLIFAAFAMACATMPSTAGAGGKDAKFKDIKIDGVISGKDDLDKLRNTPCKIHLVTLNRGQRYTIDMAGRGIAAYLRLEDKDGKRLAEDENVNGDQNAQIGFSCMKDGEYRIICSALGGGQGKYQLAVRAAGAIAASAAHAMMLGARAPDFQADFAVNGKPVKLSELQGKVVLLDFWAIQSRDATSILPRLREWHKTHGGDGLAIVSVTYYNSELGHRLGFDADEGKVVNIETASVATDQALLKEYVAYHKLPHLHLALTKEKATKTFSDYVIDGLPQVVLIDRSGIVRFVCIGESQMRNPDVDTEIKKLLSDK